MNLLEQEIKRLYEERYEARAEVERLREALQEASAALDWCEKQLPAGDRNKEALWASAQGAREALDTPSKEERREGDGLDPHGSFTDPHGKHEDET